MTEENPSLVNYLDEVILQELAHQMACELFQDKEPMGLYDDHDPAKVDSCLNLPRQAVFGNDLYPGIYKKSAIMFYAFNRNHAFGNGNKRLSAAAFVVFLFINGRVLTVNAGVLRDKALELAKTQDSIDEVVAKLAVWAEENSISIEEFRKVVKR